MQNKAVGKNNSTEIKDLTFFGGVERISDLQLYIILETLALLT